METVKEMRSVTSAIAAELVIVTALATVAASVAVAGSAIVVVLETAEGLEIAVASTVVMESVIGAERAAEAASTTGVTWEAGAARVTVAEQGIAEVPEIVAELAIAVRM